MIINIKSIMIRYDILMRKLKKITDKTLFEVIPF